MNTNRFIGRRYVPKICGNWDNTKLTEYESLSVVAHEGNSYTSKQDVPTGIDITNQDFWVCTSNYSVQYSLLNDEVKHLKSDVAEDLNEVQTNVANMQDIVNNLKNFNNIYVAESLPTVEERNEKTLYFKIIKSENNVNLLCENNVGDKVYFPSIADNVLCNNKKNLTNELKTLKKDISYLSTIIKSGTQIKMLGDSITAGSQGTGYNPTGATIYGNHKVNESGHCYANEVKTYLSNYCGANVINYGISGIKSGDIVANIGALISDDDDIITLMIGTNNRFLNDGANALEQDLKYICDYIENLGKELILLSANNTMEHDEIGKYFNMGKVDSIINKVAKEKNVYFISIYRLLEEFYTSQNSDITSITTDGLHPNDFGYDAIAYLLLREMGFNYPCVKIENCEVGTYYTSFYVDQTNGSDNNNGLSSSSGFKTIEKALSLIEYNTTRNWKIILVGNYSSDTTITINKRVNNFADITFTSNNVDVPSILTCNILALGTHFKMTYLTFEGKVILSNCTSSNFNKCTFSNPNGNIIETNDSSVGFANCTFTSSEGYYSINANWHSWLHLNKNTFNGSNGVKTATGTHYYLTGNTFNLNGKQVSPSVDSVNLSKNIDSGEIVIELAEGFTLIGSVKASYRVLNGYLTFNGVVEGTFNDTLQTVFKTAIPSNYCPSSTRKFFFQELTSNTIYGQVTQSGVLSVKGNGTKLNLDMIPPIPIA